MSVASRPRRVFPGSNTPLGFYSFYHHILPHAQAGRIFIIKGGPGTGKSTFMKRLGAEMESSGAHVEYHHCSADPHSLDAVVVGRQFAVIDGTTPHAIEPRFPGAVEEILDFGAFWDRGAIKAKREKIVAMGEERKAAFTRAFRYLKAAQAVRGEIDSEAASRVRRGVQRRAFSRFIDDLLDQGAMDVAKGRASGMERHLFGGAITPLGPVNHLDTVVGPMGRIVVVQGPPGSGKSDFMRQVVDAATAKGLGVECFHCPFRPDKIEHVVIAEADLALTTSIEPHVWTGTAHYAIDTGDDLLPTDAARVKRLDEARELFGLLFNAAIAALKEAKRLHGEVETLYSPYMDFHRLDAVYERVRDTIAAEVSRFAPA